MCDKYPNCLHGSKVMAKLPGFTRHCKTTLPNSTCKYLLFGCQGCLVKLTKKTRERLERQYSARAK